MGSSLIPEIQYSIPISSPEKPNESPIYRNPLVSEGVLLSKMHLNISTMWEAFDLNFKLHREKNNFLGYRKKLSNNSLEKKFTWINYIEAKNIIMNFSYGLHLLDLCPLIENNEEDGGCEPPLRFLGIYSRNTPEWIYAYFGAVRDSITIVTIYDTLGDFAIEYILAKTKLTSVVIEVKALKKILKLSQENKTSNLKNLVVIGIEDIESNDNILSKLKEKGFNIYSFEEVVQKGNDYQNSINNNNENIKKIELALPSPDSISTINFTSGTTGKPKGAKISHKSLILSTDVIEMLGLYPTTNDIYLSFLPYAHIMETLILGVLVSRGVQIGIYNGNAQKIIEDFQILKPTATCSVPRIFQRIYDSINSSLNEYPLYKRKIFEKAVEIKIKDYQETGMLKNAFLDNLIFRRIRNLLGGNLRFMLVGSAPVDGYLLNFLRCVLSCEIVEGYGQTEDCAGILLTKTYDPLPGHIGGPGYSTELKLIDVPELDYSHKDEIEIEIEKDGDKTNKIKVKRPRGELCVRGPILFIGYYKDDEKYKEVMDEEGWLHTGDVAMIIPEHGNAFKIIDRVKNIFKLSQGEYVAPEKIENILMGCKYIEQIFIYGDTLQNFVVAILVPKEKEVVDFLKKNNKISENDNYLNYFEDEDLINDILKEIDSYARKNDLKGFEIPKKIFLSKERFSIENHILTPTMKIRRHEAKKKFIYDINKLYGINNNI